MNSEIKSRIHQIKLLAIDLLVAADTADMDRLHAVADELALLFQVLHTEKEATKRLLQPQMTPQRGASTITDGMATDCSGATVVTIEQHNEGTAE